MENIITETDNFGQIIEPCYRNNDIKMFSDEIEIIIKAITNCIYKKINDALTAYFEG